MGPMFVALALLALLPGECPPRERRNRRPPRPRVCLPLWGSIGVMVRAEVLCVIDTKS